MSQHLYPRNFLGLPDELADYAKARVAVLPMPYDATCSYRSGASRGPAAIIEASNYVELWDEELDRDTFEVGIATLDPVAPAKDGPESQVRRIHEVAKRLVADGKFVLGLGGEHTVSIGVVQAYKERYPDLAVLQIDAHLDLRDDYEGTKYSHASVMRRISEMGCPIVTVGVRAFERPEWEYAREAGIKVFKGREIYGSTAFVKDAVAAAGNPLYVTIDLDGFDPKVLPSTGTPEPGGLDYYQALALLKALGESRDVVGCDVVELSPDGVHHSDMLAARIAYKMLGYFVREPAGGRTR